MKYESFLKTAIEAGKAILEIYNNSTYQVEIKADESPLTTADLKSNEIINKELNPTGLPILSEENKEIEYESRSKWHEFILVDPLDGTKEFIKRNGEFTVNIALIKNNKPVFGVIYAPVPDILYWGSEEGGSWKLDGAVEVFEKELFTAGIATRLPDKRIREENLIKVVASKSHFSDETKSFIENIEKTGKKTKLVSRGSSLKLCMVAEGSADIYPRLGPTMEWDIAAGHAIAKFAGCNIRNYETDMEPVYNKETLLNPWFVVSRI